MKNLVLSKLKTLKTVSAVFLFLSCFLIITFDRSLLTTLIAIGAIVFFIIVQLYFFLIKDKSSSKKEKLQTIVFFSILMLLLSSYLFFYKSPVRVDFTKNQAFTLSEKSKEILKKLDFKVKIIVLQQDYTPDNSLGQFGKEIYVNVKNLVQEYKKESSLIQVEFLNPESDDVKAKNYKMKNVGDIIIETDKGTKYLNKEYLVEWGSRKNPNSGDFERLITAYKIEEKITTTLLGLFDKNKPKILWLQGDGELDFDGNLSANFFKEELENNNFVIEKTDFLNPENSQVLIEAASALVIAGPQKTLPEGKIKLIESFLSKGKTLLLFVDPSLDEVKTGLEKLLEDQYQIKLLNHIVVDDYHSYQTISNISAFYFDHEINRPLMRQSFQTILFMASPIEVIEKNDKSSLITHENLLSASGNAWEEKNMKAVKKTGRLDLSKKYDLNMNINGKKDEHDHGKDDGHDHEHKKPIFLSTIAANRVNHSKVFVIGDSDFIKNPNLAISGNKDFIINSVNYLLERKTPLSISKPINIGQTLLVQDGKKTYFLIFYIIFLPLVIVGIGVFIGFKRRKMKIAVKK